ncbi:MAG: elongation factor P [Myxococcota bacterium]
MSVIETSEFKRGVHIELDGEPYTIVDIEKQAPTARGGKTLVRVKVRNMKSGQLLDKAFKAGDVFKEPDLAREDTTYSYETPEAFVFMNTETYEQVEVPREILGDEGRFLQEGMVVRLRRFNGVVISAELPQYVDCTVSSVVPGARGDTASRSVTTEATLENGVKLQVPLYIKAGDRVRVDPKTGEFRERAG